MEKTTQVIRIDNILDGFSDFSKLNNIYAALRKEILTSSPIQKSNAPLITLHDPNWRRGSYGWELFEQEHVLYMIEFFNGDDGYSKASDLPIDPRTESFDFLILTIHNGNKNIRKSIEEIILRFPREPIKKT